MKMSSKFAILPALLIGLASVAYADSVEIGSFGTFQSPHNNANTALAYLRYSNTAITTAASSQGTMWTYNLTPAAGWVPAITNGIYGSSWVAESNSGGGYGGGDPTDGYYEYTSTFSAVGGTYNGTIDLAADDTAAIWINGTRLVNYGDSGQDDGVCTNGQPNCQSIDYITVSGLVLNSGTNIITIVDDQVYGGPDGVDFQGDLTKTPEPSSLLLMGSGLLGLAMVAFRKAKANRLVLHS
jgi:hypothetical protein